MRGTSCLLLFLLAFVAESVLGQVYQSFRTRLIYRIIPLSSFVQDDRIRCNITDVFAGFDASVCELPLSDLNTFNESNQGRITTMCFGVYDLLFEICSRVNRTGNQKVENVLNEDLRQSYNISNFCVEMGETNLVPIQHKKSILDKWSEYLTNQLVSTKLCEDFCQSHDGKVHIMCKIIQAGHQYLNITSNRKHSISPPSKNWERSLVHSTINETVNGKLNTRKESQIEEGKHSISPPSKNWERSLVHSTINETVNGKLNSRKESQIEEGEHSIPLTSENWDQSVVHSSINETLNEKLETTKQSQIVEESSTKRSIEPSTHGVSGYALWFAVVSVVLLLTMIVVIARFIRSKFQRNERLLSTRPSPSYTEMSAIENERKLI